jgi:hypothetical protein
VLVIAGDAVALVLAVWASHLVLLPAEIWGLRTFYGAVAACAEPRLDLRAVAFAAAITLLHHAAGRVGASRELGARRSGH